MAHVNLGLHTLRGCEQGLYGRKRKRLLHPLCLHSPSDTRAHQDPADCSAVHVLGESCEPALKLLWYVQVSGSGAIAALHPSWVAKKQQASLPQAQGKKIVFDD